MKIYEELNIVTNPLTTNLYNICNQILISPGAPEFIATENLFRITTEDGVPLITEG